MKKFSLSHLTFAEMFSVLIVFAGLITYYTSEKFNYGFLNKITPIFYSLLLISLIAVIIFKFRCREFLYISLIVSFAFFYATVNYIQNKDLPKGYKFFAARVISDIKYRNDRSNFEVKLIKNFEPNHKRFLKYSDKAMVITDAIYPGLERGSIITGIGKFLIVNREKSEYNLFLFSKGIDWSINASDIVIHGFGSPSIFYKNVLKLKMSIERICNRIIPYPHSTFVYAILTGDRRLIPSYLTGIFKRVGTLHILAISGLHVGFIAGMFIALFMILGFKHVALYLIVSFFVTAYTFFIGGSPSVKRAGLMFVLGVLLYILDRDRDYINLIAVVFLFFMLGNPRSIYNPGFLLSFFATFGIVYLSNYIKKKLDSYLPGYLTILISMSLAASIYTFPIMIAYFGKFSYVSIIANVAIIPITAIILLLSVITIVIYPVFLPLSILVAQLDAFFVSLLFMLNAVFSYVRPISFRFNVPGNLVIFAYFSIVTFLAYYFRRRKKSLNPVIPVI